MDTRGCSKMCVGGGGGDDDDDVAPLSWDACRLFARLLSVVDLVLDFVSKDAKESLILSLRLVKKFWHVCFRLSMGLAWPRPGLLLGGRPVSRSD